MSRPIAYSPAAIARKEAAAMRALVKPPVKRSSIFPALLAAALVIGATGGAFLGLAF